MSPSPQDNSPPPVPATNGVESEVPNTHPIGMWFFFWGEFAERCSFYGMRAILPLYLTKQLHFSDAKGGAIYSIFKTACYLLPLLGGFLADRFFGKYWTIVGFSIPYVLGHFVLGIEDQTAAYIALALLAGGSGVIKPNVSSLMGMTYDQQRPGKEALRTSAFLWFYFSINVGALISQVALPILRNDYGYAVAFQFPAWLMVISLAIFALGKRFYAEDIPSRDSDSPEALREKWATLRRLFGVFGLLIFFWIAYEQNDSVWIFFARDYMNLNVPFSKEPLQADQFQYVNPLCVMLLIPFFSWLFRKVDPNVRLFTASRKILMGFLATALATGTMSLAGYLAVGSGEKISLAWLIGSIIVLTIGEVLLYGTCLDLAYSMAPKNMKSFVTACLLLTSALGNLVNSQFIPLYGGSLKDAIENRGPLSPGDFFGITALMVLGAAVAFYFVGRRLGSEKSEVINAK